MEPLTAERLATATGRPVARLAARWPELRAELVRQGVTDPASQAAFAATVDVETAGEWTPLREYVPTGVRDRAAYFEGIYGGRRDLGNDRPGDGGRYYGRGEIQLTGKRNYQTYSAVAGADLVAAPDALLARDTSARVAIAFWKASGADRAARAHDWTLARRRVNGGFNGYPRYAYILWRLGYPGAAAPIAIAALLMIGALVAGQVRR